jgi:hypothetical protein
MKKLSWICKFGICEECDGFVVVTQPTEKYCDYWYYCADKRCINHSGEQVGDQESPVFLKSKEDVNGHLRNWWD